MRICILGNASKQGFFTQLWKQHLSRNHEVMVVSFHPPENHDAHTIYIPHTPMSLLKPLSFYNVIKNVRRELRQLHPDVLISLYVTHYGYLGETSSITPHVVVPLGSDIAVDPYTSHLKRHMVRITLQNANLILVQDLLSEQQVRSLGGRNTKTIPWGVTLPHRKHNLRKHYDVINLNGYSFEKHHIDIYLRMVQKLQQKNPQIRCVLVGADQKSRDRADELGITGCLKMTPVLSHVETLKMLCRSKVFVETFKPNHNRGGHTYGMSVLEAMAYKIPTVVADRPTVTQLRGEHKWYRGMVFDGSVESLHDGVMSLLENNVLYETVLKDNYMEIEKRFNLDRNMAAIEQVVTDLAS